MSKIAKINTELRRFFDHARKFLEFLTIVKISDTFINEV